MNRVKWRKAVPSLIYLLVVGLFFWQTFEIKQSTSGTMGMITPRTVPRIILLCLAVLAVINLVHDVKSEGEEQPYIQNVFKYLIVAAAFLFVALTVKQLGFVPCGIVFLFALFQVMDDQKPSKNSVIKNMILAVLFSVLFCYGFRYGLNVRLPLYPR